MKNFTKIFMAVVAGMFAFSCVTDATEDLGIEVGKGGGNTQITVSLEESRTQLGERNADGKYPLYWSAGDQIAINGVASVALAEGGNAAATFSFGEVLTTPYSVVYPASEGANVVNFLAEQPYTVGTFAPKAAPMYGYAATAGNAIELNHLTGVLRLAVKGNGEAITSVVITSELGKIAGPFTVDCTNGALTAQEGASNTVTVTFAEPLVLGAEATPIYAAVPAGNYGTFAITLHTATDKMTVKFNSATKPVAVGMVREFKEFTYQANDVEAGGTVFEIDGKDALIEFASKVADGSFATSYTAAAVVANIDMTGYNWAPIEGFNGFTFDGGKASGYAINGLTAPLFGSTNSTIQNVDLTNVNIASNDRLILGAVACKLVAGDSQSLISNCHVSGSITVNNTALIPENTNTYYGINIAGIVGYIAGGAVDNCVNEANITITQLGSNESAKALHPCIGGIVGAASVTGDILSPITNCVNGSQGGVTGTIKYLDKHPNQLYIPQVGGIVGLSSDSNRTDIKSNTNYAPIEFNANAAGDGGIDYGSTCIGGIFGYSRCAVEGNNNHGKISVLGGKIKAFYLGGVGGVVTLNTVFDNNHNHNSEGILVDSGVTFFSLNVAGVIGGVVGGSGTFNNCTNNAPIVSKASTATDITTGSWYYRVSGVVTYTNRAISNCENKANGDITVSGNIIVARNNNQSGIAVTGVSAYHTTDGSIVNLINRGDINVNTNMSLHSGITDVTHGKICIAGVNGYNTRSMRDLQNYGNINIGNTSSDISIAGNGVHIAGLVSVASGSLGVTNLEKNINKGNITINRAKLNGRAIASKNTLSACIGGLAAYYTGTSFANSENEGDITLNQYIAVGNVYLYLGGNIGFTTGEVTLKNCKNIGTLTVSDKITKAFWFYAGGLVGTTSKAITFDNCHNAMKAGVANGWVVKGTWADASDSNTVRIGGIVGQQAGGVITMKNGVTNSANMLLAAKYRDSGGFSVGGIAGVCSSYAHTFTGLVQNSGNIYYEGECPKGTFCLAGCMGQFGTNAAKSIEKLVNTGNITAVKTVANSFPTGAKNGLIAGIAASCSGNLPNAQSVCTITAIDMEDRNHASSTKDGVTTYYHNSVGAIVGGITAASILSNCHAGGKIVTMSEVGDSVEDPEGGSETPAIETPGILNTSNYAAWLSGDHEFTSAAAKTQKCGYISAIDATPEYAE